MCIGCVALLLHVIRCCIDMKLSVVFLHAVNYCYCLFFFLMLFVLYVSVLCFSLICKIVFVWSQSCFGSLLWHCVVDYVCCCFYVLFVLFHCVLLNCMSWLFNVLFYGLIV